MFSQFFDAETELAIFHCCNAMFLLLTAVTAFFIFVLMRQRTLTTTAYTMEVINNQKVNVIYSENWEESDLPVFIILPGNPGQAGFYTEYIDLVVSATKGTYRGCAVSHVGHSPATSKVWNVKDQVDSKINFITSKLKPGTSITLIGHSFGCYLALKIMEKGIKIDKTIMLFPMIDNMAKTPKATNLLTMLRFKSAIILIAQISGWLPGFLKLKMIQFYSSKMSTDIQDYMTATIAELIEPSALSNIFGLAQNELAIIKDPDYKLIRKFKNKIVFYYGMFDMWAPLDCLRNLRRNVPQVNAHVADDDISHTFMFNSCAKVARKTADFMTQDSCVYDQSNLFPHPDEMLDGNQEPDEYDFCDD